MTLNGASTVGNNGVLALSGGTITGTGALTVSGTGKFNWSNGTLSGTGKKTISGALNLLNGYQSLDGTTLETSGATIWTGSGSFYGYNNAIWNNTSTGTIDLQGDADFYLYSGAAVSFNNAGTFTKSNGATDNSDTTLPLTATFAAGSKTVNVSLSPIDDNIFETSTPETEILTLTAGSNYTLGTAKTATINITDNDLQPTIKINDVTVTEGNSGKTSAIFTVTLSNPSSQAITVNYATADGTSTIADLDYANTTGVLTFAGGETSKTVTVLVNGDTKSENPENFTLNLTNPTNSTILDAQGLGTVNNDDLPVSTVIATDASAAETAIGITANPGTFTLTRAGDLTQAVTVNYTVAGTATNGTDYTSIPLTANFGIRVSTALVNISPIDDSIFEGTETVILNLATRTGYTLGTTAGATVNINDNDTAGSAVVTVSATDTSAAETATGVTPNSGTFTFARTGNTISALTVNYTLSGTAINGSDYTSLAGTITFAENASTTTININAINDTIFETSTPKTVILTLATGQGYTLGTATTGTVSISDNDSQPVINLSASQTVVEGFTNPQSVSYTVTLNNASSQIITVNYATANGTALAGSDYTNTSETLTFGTGVTSQAINIPILNDSLNEANETFALNLTSPTNAILGTSTTTTTITDTLASAVTTTLAANVENLTLTGTAVINGTGHAGANVLTGNSANNTLTGLDGNDTYSFIVNSPLGTDTINETTTGGIDAIAFTGTSNSVNLNLGVITSQTVNNNLKLILTANNVIENATGGTGTDRLTGNSLNNMLTGSSGNDQLQGLAGDDILWGGLGDDLLTG